MQSLNYIGYLVLPMLIGLPLIKYTPEEISWTIFALIGLPGLLLTLVAVFIGINKFKEQTPASKVLIFVGLILLLMSFLPLEMTFPESKTLSVK